MQIEPIHSTALSMNRPVHFLTMARAVGQHSASAAPVLCRFGTYETAHINVGSFCHGLIVLL